MLPSQRPDSVVVEGDVRMGGQERLAFAALVVREDLNQMACSAMGVGQNQWYHFGVGGPPILVYFIGDWVFTGGTGF